MSDRAGVPSAARNYRVQIDEEKRKAKRTLYLALALGACAAIANLIAFQQAEGTKITVLKAKSRLSPGAKVTSSSFVPVVIAGVPSEMRALVVEEKNFAAYQKIPLASAVQPGELLLQTSFTTATTGSIRDMIPEGYRALALTVKDESAALDWQIAVGDIVDVYALSGKLIVSKVQVSAVGDSTGVPGLDSKYRTVTIIIPTASVPEVLSDIHAVNEDIRLAVVGASGQ